MAGGLINTLELPQPFLDGGLDIDAGAVNDVINRDQLVLSVDKVPYCECKLYRVVFLEIIFCTGIIAPFPC
jgi:hypothetical protein